MSELYDTITRLCSEKGINITELCRQSGASRGSLTDLKMGRKNSLSASTLSKIAVYFGVSVDYLLGNEEKEKPATDEGDGLEDLLKDQFIAFYGEVKDSLDETDIEDLKTFMRMKAEIKKNREKK